MHLCFIFFKERFILSSKWAVKHVDTYFLWSLKFKGFFIFLIYLTIKYLLYKYGFNLKQFLLKTEGRTDSFWLLCLRFLWIISFFSPRCYSQTRRGKEIFLLFKNSISFPVLKDVAYEWNLLGNGNGEDIFSWSAGKDAIRRWFSF